MMDAIGQLDEFNFYVTMQKSQGVSLVFFSGPHCASCHHLKSLLNRDYTIFSAHYFRKGLDFSIYEIKAEQATALVNQFTVFHLPTMYVYLHGEFHCELQAQATTPALLVGMDKAITQAAEEEP